MKRLVIGADIGGSHITCAIVDIEKAGILKDSHVVHSPT